MEEGKCNKCIPSTIRDPKVFGFPLQGGFNVKAGWEVDWTRTSTIGGRGQEGGG